MFPAQCKQNPNFIAVKKMECHNANMSKFIETWKDYVDPAGVTASPGAEARAGARVE